MMKPKRADKNKESNWQHAWRINVIFERVGLVERLKETGNDSRPENRWPQTRKALQKIKEHQLWGKISNFNKHKLKAYENCGTVFYKMRKEIVCKQKNCKFSEKQQSLFQNNEN